MARRMEDNHADELSISDVVGKLKQWRRYLWLQWKLILIVMLTCSLIGLTYALFKKPVYIAESTFVLQEEGNSTLGQYADLAAIAGVTLNSESNGLFTSDNIIELFKSRNILKKTLLSHGLFNSKPQLLIERYIDFNKLRSKWSDKPDLANISFQGDSAKFTITQDSVIFDIAKEINKKNLLVDKPDKKLSIIDVQVISKDQLFAKYFNENLVNNVSRMYVATKSEKAAMNLRILQQQTDSVRRLLNTSISGAAFATDVTPNPNPNMTVLHVAAQRKTVDVKTSSEVYSQLVQNLELAKITLRRETPLIQMIDKPELPLDEEKAGKLLYTFVGAVIGLFMAICYIIYRTGVKA